MVCQSMTLSKDYGKGIADMRQHNVTENSLAVNIHTIQLFQRSESMVRSKPTITAVAMKLVLR